MIGSGLLVQVALASTSLSADDVAALELFEAACIEGGVSSEVFSLAEADFVDLPVQGRGRFYAERQIATVYRIGSEPETFLVHFDREDATGDELSRGCGIVRKGMNVPQSLYWLGDRLGFEIQPMTRRAELDTFHFTIEPSAAQGRYFIDAMDMGDHSTVIRVNFRNPEQIAQIQQTESPN